MQAADVKRQLDHFQTSLETDATYRDTLYTEHQLAVETRLQDSDARASDTQEKHRQEVEEMQKEHLGILENQIAKSGKLEARMEDLTEDSRKELALRLMFHVTRSRTNRYS